MDWIKSLTKRILTTRTQVAIEDQDLLGSQSTLTAFRTIISPRTQARPVTARPAHTGLAPEQVN